MSIIFSQFILLSPAAFLMFATFPNGISEERYIFRFAMNSTLTFGSEEFCNSSQDFLTSLNFRKCRKNLETVNVDGWKWTFVLENLFFAVCVMVNHELRIMPTIVCKLRFLIWLIRFLFEVTEFDLTLWFLPHDKNTRWKLMDLKVGLQHRRLRSLDKQRWL